MSSKLQQFGLVATGLVAGVFLSLNFSASANKEAASALPLEELRSFADVYSAIKQGYVEPVEDKKLITHAISGMLANLDPHSAYLDPDSFKDLQVSTQGEFGGLGIEVGMEDGFVKVVSPIEDTPAHRAGLKPGDLIIKIDDTPVKGLTLNDAVKKMRGKPKTQIRLTVVRKTEQRSFDVTLVREKIKVQSVKSKLLDGGYGYLRVTQFQEETAPDVVKHLEKLAKVDKDAKGEGVKGLVLDLRNDPGGLLSGAVGVSAAFLAPQMLVTSTDGRTGDAKRRYMAAPEDYQRGTRDDFMKASAGLGQDRADDRAGQWRFRFGIRDRRRRPAGPQTRRRHGHPDLWQGLGADRAALVKQRRHQADHGALFHALGPLDPGQGHHPRHRGRGIRQRQRFAHPRARGGSRAPPHR
jgi:carboxyl-terminal processing protease